MKFETIQDLQTFLKTILKNNKNNYILTLLDSLDLKTIDVLLNSNIKHTNLFKYGVSIGLSEFILCFLIQIKYIKSIKDLRVLKVYLDGFGVDFGVDDNFIKFLGYNNIPNCVLCRNVYIDNEEIINKYVRERLV